MKRIIIEIVKMFVIILLGIFLEKNCIYSLNETLRIAILGISALLTVRFILRCYSDIEFNSYSDLLISLIAGYTIGNYLFSSVDVNLLVGKTFFIKTESHVLQLFIFHLYWMLNIIIALLFSVALIMCMAMITSCFFKLLLKADYLNFINLMKNINDKSIKYLKVDIIKFLNNYLNPFKGISIKPVYKNTKLIKMIIFIVYLMTGVLILYYFKDLLSASTNFELIKDINSDDFKQYGAIFVTPIIGIFIGKLFSNKKSE